MVKNLSNLAKASSRSRTVINGIESADHKLPEKTYIGNARFTRKMTWPKLIRRCQQEARNDRARPDQHFDSIRPTG
jgi:hypothetical protein